MKKSEMKDDVTYLLCPDKKCKLFWDDTQSLVCERSCPKVKKLVKMIICLRCREIIELPGDHHIWCRIDHECPDGGMTSNFSRMECKYHLLYKKPK